MYVRLLLGLLCFLGCANLANASPFAYVANYNGNGSGNGVTVIDLANDSVSATIQLPVAQGRTVNPYGVAVNRFGSHVYVSNRTDTNVFDIDTSNNSVSTITIPFKPSGLAVNPAGTRLYVANAENGSVTVIDTVTRSVIKTVAAGAAPQGVAVNPAGDRVYVANSSQGGGSTSTVSVFNATADSMAVAATINVDAAPMGVAITPDGARLYVACADSGTVNVIDTATNTVASTIPAVGSVPFGVAINATGSKVYVTLAGLENAVAVIDTSTNTVEAGKISVGASPMGISIAPDDSKLVAANSLAGNASIINPATKTVSTTVAVADGPESLGNFVGPVLVPVTLNPGYHGSITPVDPITVDPSTKILQAPKGRDLPLNVTPDTNYAIQSVTVNGVAKSQPYTLTNVQAPQTVAATFNRVSYTINFTKGGTGSGDVHSNFPASPTFTCGSSCVSSTLTYPKDIYVEFVATADPGSTFLGWQGSGCAAGADCGFTTNGQYVSLDGEYYLSAVFSKNAVSSFQGQYDSASSGGSITCSATYAAEPANSFVAATKAVTVIPASPSTTLNLPAATTTGKFTISGAGAITISGGGSFIIQ